MEVDFVRERRRILLALVLALTAGFLPVIMGTWLLARRTVGRYPVPAEVGTIWISLGFGAVSCAAIVVLAVVMVNRYHRMLLRAATRDHVTGAYNRQAFEPMAADLVSAATRAGDPLAAVLFDIDDFKRFNDCHGHSAGDAALREVTRAATRVVRGTDIVTRWGGDEFVVLLPACTAPQAAGIADRLRAAVRACDPQRAGMPAHISISTGIAQLQPGEDVAGLIARADGAMYSNRRATRSASH